MLSHGDKIEKCINCAANHFLAKACDQRLSCRSYKGNHTTDIHGCIPKDKLKIDGSAGQDEDKKIANNYADLIVATTRESSYT